MNPHKLQDAIGAITEGGSALGIHCCDVYDKMAQDKEFIMELFELIHGGDEPSREFITKFNETAADMLLSLEAVRG